MVLRDQAQVLSYYTYSFCPQLVQMRRSPKHMETVACVRLSV